MAWIDEEVCAQFARFEQRGRGWRVWPHPVEVEPPFVPFTGYTPDTSQFADDGRRPNSLISALTKLGVLVKAKAPAAPPEPTSEPEPDVLERTGVIELQLSLPARFAGKQQDIAPLFTQLGLCREPLAFEIVATGERIVIQFAAHADDAPTLRRHINAHFPDVVVTERERLLACAWEAADNAEGLVVEFGLARESVLPLARLNTDPYIGLVSSLSELSPGELALFQVIFQPVENPWADHLLRAVSDESGKPFFQNAPELTTLTREKISSPLFAVIVRIAIRADDFDRTLAIARDMAGALRIFARLDGNELIPLLNTDYPYEAHVEDVVLRQSRRSGMLLNAEELTGFVHLPSADVRTAKLKRDSGKTRSAPKASMEGQEGLLLGQNTHAGQTFDVRLSPPERSRHLHLVGASGTGKSTMLFNLIQQDIESGQGCAVLDPHGDLIDRILGCIPENRINDVIVFDPSDEQYSIGFNVLSAHSDLEKNLLASDLISVFQRLSTSWGDQMGSVLQNAILAFLESSRGGTLADLRRFLLETEFRNDFLLTVNDPEIVYYWRKAFPQLSGNKSVGPVLTRLETFLAPKPIRYMVSQPVNRLDFREIMDTGKVFLAKLSQGQVGKENAFLLGSLLMAKFQQTAMSRQAQDISSRKPFWLYLDEFQNFITPSMAEILTGARKYNVGLVLAHQELRQLERDREVASAVLSNCYTRVAFRVGDDDARKLAEGFASFEARDLQNLDTFLAICRIERSDHDFNLSVALPRKEDTTTTTKRREQIITVSREKYGTPRADVEAMLRKPVEQVVKAKAAAPSAPLIPTAPEVPKATELEKNAVVVVPAEVKLPAIADIPKTPRDPGKGGARHKAIQHRIKQAADALGFRSTIEKQIADSQQSVDLLLERSDQTIACEISISTTIDHEVGNVAKCLKAGFPKVAVICLDDKRLEAIAAAVSGSLGAEAGKRVVYVQPDQFIADLHQMPLPAPPEASESTVVRHGYKVKRSMAKLTLEEQRQKEDAAIRLLAEAMRKIKP